jgi:aminopeptidase N
MRSRMLVALIGLVGLITAVVLVVVLVPWRQTDRTTADTRPPAQGTTPQQVAAPPPPPLPPLHPVAGAPGIGDPYFPQAGNGGYDVTGYDIQLRYEPAGDRLQGRTTISARPTEDLSRFNLDLMLPASAVAVQGQPATFQQSGGELQVTPAQPLRAGEPMAVQVDYAGVPSSVPGPPDDFAPWQRTPDGGAAVGEPQSAAWWYPSNDHPSDKATMSVSVTVPSGVEAISNGALLGGPEPADQGWDRWRWQAKEPMAPYLAFVAMGQYDIVRRNTPQGPYLAAYAQGLEPALARTARQAVEQTPEIVGVLSTMFGPYPFSQLGGVVPDAEDMFFALENQTRPVYGPVFFAGTSDNTVVAHELAHQWFGDNVSLHRWRDIWLNEGFATYAEWLFSERTGGATAKQHAAEAYRANAANPEYWKVPPGEPGPKEVLGEAVYSRGGMALEALRTRVGDDAFFTTLRAWSKERQGGNGSVEDFLALLERVSGQQVDDVAQTWLFSPTRPPSPPA